MTNQTKQRVIAILEAKLAGAKDDLYRTNMMFLHVADLEQEYGESGRSCTEVIEDAQVQVVELKRCLNWVRTAQ